MKLCEELTREPPEPSAPIWTKLGPMEKAYQTTIHQNFQLPKLIWEPFRGVSKFKNNGLKFLEKGHGVDDNVKFVPERFRADTQVIGRYYWESSLTKVLGAIFLICCRYIWGASLKKSTTPSPHNCPHKCPFESFINFFNMNNAFVQFWNYVF